MNLNDFITRHEHASFRHSEELFAAIQSVACVLKRAPDEIPALPCSHYLHIYRRRAKHLRRFDTPHAASISADIEVLLGELERSPDEPCDIWLFSLPPHHLFTVFEVLASQHVLGCIRAVDQRLMNEAAWEELWHQSSRNV